MLVVVGVVVRIVDARTVVVVVGMTDLGAVGKAWRWALTAVCIGNMSCPATAGEVNSMNCQGCAQCEHGPQMRFSGTSGLYVRDRADTQPRSAGQFADAELRYRPSSAYLIDCDGRVACLKSVVLCVKSVVFVHARITRGLIFANHPRSVGRLQQNSRIW